MNNIESRKNISLSQTKILCDQLRQQADGGAVNIIMKQVLLTKAAQNAENSIATIDDFYRRHRVAGWFCKLIDKFPKLGRYHKLANAKLSLDQALNNAKTEMSFNRRLPVTFNDKIYRAIPNLAEAEDKEITIQTDELFKELEKFKFTYLNGHQMLNRLVQNKDLLEPSEDIKSVYGGKVGMIKDISNLLESIYSWEDSRGIRHFIFKLTSRDPNGDEPFALKIWEEKMDGRESNWRADFVGAKHSYGPNGDEILIGSEVVEYEVDRLKNILDGLDPYFKLAE